MVWLYGRYLPTADRSVAEQRNDRSRHQHGTKQQEHEGERSCPSRRHRDSSISAERLEACCSQVGFAASNQLSDA